MKKFTNLMVMFVKKYLPSPFSLAIVLSIVVFFLGVFTTETNINDMVVFWGDGIYSNLAFIMQMIMILFAGYALAISPVVTKILKTISSIPKTRYGALAFTFTIAYVCGYINWGFGLVAAALIAKEVSAKNYGKKIDFPIMVAASYAATQVAALSSAVPLQIATPSHFLEETIGVIPLSETLFSLHNIALTLVIWLAVVILLKFINPSEKDAVEVDFGIIEAEELANKIIDDEARLKGKTPAAKLDNCKLLTYAVVALSFWYVAIFFTKNSFLNLSTNIVITIFIGLGLGAHKTPSAYVKSVDEAIKTCAGIALLFPFYYGLMGMMRYSGLAAAMSEWFVSISTVQTLPMYTFWSASLVNLFVPSGGGQWAVQGPVMMEAAISLGADVAKTAMAVCWGDLCTNLIQPFWAIPVLAIAKLDVKDIMGYCIVIGILEFVIISLFFLVGF